MAYFCIISITVTLSIVVCAASLECFNCTGVTNTDSCQNKLACGENKVCFTQRTYSGQIAYALGCIESQKCGDFANLPSGIAMMDTNQGQTQPCFECCSMDGCNSNLCQSKNPDVCVDDEGFDCAYYNSLFNFCKDVNQAKKVCPKYCKLCQVVDGIWTPWSTWSECDVTCEKGTQVRTRSCTDPAPQYGGLDCWGNDTETKSCHREPCPIHGGWNTWSTWSECSVSCDIGMQHRDRSCTNPRPSLFGDHCFGSDEQYRICMPGACAEHSVAFTAYDVYRISSTTSYATLRFIKTYTNYGSGYDTTTGTFTCKCAGVYHFVVTLLKYYQDIAPINAFLKINGAGKLHLHFNPKTDNSNEVGAYMMTSAGTFHLDQNDVVDVYGVPNYFNSGDNSFFTGFLITPDQ